MLDRVMNAESVAVVGASKNPTKRGYQTVRTLLDEKYEGDIYPVNPKEKRILGLRCFKSVSEIEDPVDIALVATPHIGGQLRLYRVEADQLALFAHYSGVSTHRIGSTQLGLGRVVSASPRDRLLVPNQSRRALMLLEWTGSQWQEIARVELPGVLGSSLKPVRNGC